MNCTSREKLFQIFSLPPWHSMARANLNKSEVVLTNTTAAYLRGPESASIEIPLFRPHFIKFSKDVFYEVNLVSQCSHLEVLLLNKEINLGLKGGILIDADSGRPMYLCTIYIL